MARKKTRKRRQAPPGTDPNLKRQERLQAKREARLRAAAAARRARMRERVVRVGLLTALAAAAVWFFFLRGQNPEAIAGHPIESFAETGASDHTDQPVSYQMTPPVTGPHDLRAAPCGTYNQQIPNENFVHTLEHGAIAILFDPGDVDQATVNQIEDLVGSYDELVVSGPYAGMETPVTVASWGEMMRLESFDEEATREYIDTFVGEGPEDRPCPTEADDHFEVAPPTPTPTQRNGGGGNDS